MNHSKQRELVLNIVKEKRWHPTADEVYVEAKKIMPNISLGTVYRNLSQLSEAYEISKITNSAGESCFDGEVNDHIHFLCIKCGKLIDIENEIANKSVKAIFKCTDNKVLSSCIVLKGYCSLCNK